MIALHTCHGSLPYPGWPTQLILSPVRLQDPNIIPQAFDRASQLVPAAMESAAEEGAAGQNAAGLFSDALLAEAMRRRKLPGRDQARSKQAALQPHPLEADADPDVTPPYRIEKAILVSLTPGDVRG